MEMFIRFGLFTVIHVVVFAPAPYPPSQLIEETADWCRYKYFVSSLSWAAAFDVCNQNNQTLAQISGPSEHSLVASLVATSMSQIAHTMFSVQETLWIGLHAEASTANAALLWGDCEPYSINTDHWDDTGTNGGCVMYNTTSQKYVTAPCHENKQFICEAIEPDNASCFTYLSSVIPSVSAVDSNFVDFTSCYQDCTDKCFAIQWKTTPECARMTIMTNPGVSLGRTGMYTKGVLDFQPLSTVSVTFKPHEICESPASEEATITPTATVEQHSSISADGHLSPTTTDEAVATSYNWTPVLPFTSDTINTSPTYHPPSGSSATEPAPAVTTDTIATTTSETTNTVPNTTSTSTTTTTTTTSTTCYCRCDQTIVSNVTLTQEQLLQVVEELKLALSVDKKELSSYKRKLTSASDERASAKGIGYVGAAILITVFSTLVIFDAPRILADTKRFVKLFCSCCFVKKYSMQPKL